MPTSPTSLVSAKRSAERNGITSMGFNVALRRLLAKQMVAGSDIWDERHQDSFAGLKVTESGWNWIDQNDKQFVFVKEVEDDDGDIPF